MDFPINHVLPLARSFYTTPPSWLLDYSAFHCITNDLQNLSVKGGYDGVDHLQVLNNSLPIMHIGSTSISSTLSACHISNVLFASNITQNLI